MSAELQMRRTHKMNTVSTIQKGTSLPSPSLFSNSNNNIKKKLLSKEIKKINEINESSIYSGKSNQSNKNASYQKNLSIDISQETPHLISRKKTALIPTNNFRKNSLRNPPHQRTLNHFSSMSINTKNVAMYKIPSNEINLERAASRNAINFMDRTKIKATKVVNLKLFDEETRQNTDQNEFTEIPTNNKEYSLFRSNYSLKKRRDSVINELYTRDNILNNLSPYHRNSVYNKNNKTENKKKTKYSLNQLMQLNPYYLIPSKVKYCNAIEMQKISERLSHVDGVNFNKKTTSQRHFFKTDSAKFNTKIIDSYSVSFNNNVNHKGGLVWRILEKLKNTPLASTFKQACKYKGYSDLWKHYGMIVELLIANYSEFKWFLEKDKYMNLDVFKEYLQCLEKSGMKKDKTFLPKVFLLFDDKNEGKINIKIFFFIMKLVSPYTTGIDEVSFILRLMEDVKRANTNLCINVMDTFEVFKSIISFENHIKDNAHLLANLRQEFNNGEIISTDFYITKNQLKSFLVTNKCIRKIFENFKKEYKFAYITYNEQVNFSFNSTVRNVKKFLNEQNEINVRCNTNIKDMEGVLRAVKEKKSKVEKLKKINKFLEDVEE